MDIFLEYYNSEPVTTSERLFKDGIITAFAFVCYMIMNWAMIIGGWMRSDANGRYMAIHVVCNAYVVLVHLDEVYYTNVDPSRAMWGYCDTKGTCAIFALHLFHIAFFRPLPPVDWLHHSIMVILMLPLGYALQPGPLLGHGAFFTSGLPGGIDYFMLVLVKNKCINSMTEKYYNSIIQLWIRCPGCLAHSFYTWTAYIEYIKLSQWGHFNIMPNMMLPESIWIITPITMVVILAFSWNGLYFMSRVITNYAVKSYELKRLIGKDK
jgi:hypothetical protein